MVLLGLGGLAAFGRRPNWPSDAAGWPLGQTEQAKPAKGRADLRAPKRSAARRSRSGGPKKNVSSRKLERDVYRRHQAND
ncbi:hypothetical protein SapgrDRAFT_1489 [Saprospira grandis DSM 2844]|uniref:Uncharacterized protein n=1 Tax=Saprospira grandis DSM 2844 TaxID=694433 RepID=J1I3D3_9BACT|nr:hypothetical protein SapgrDRAFT_1489 [Saprospira grandis DSM 2844]